MKAPSFPGWTRFFPPFGWLAAYRREWLPSDIVAGITLAAYAVPVSLAYVALAGLPPQIGVYLRLHARRHWLCPARGIAAARNRPDLGDLPDDRCDRRRARRRRCCPLRADRKPRSF